MLRPFLVLCLFLSFQKVGMAQSYFILEKPSSTNFPDTADWPILTNSSAPADLAHPFIEDNPLYVEYEVNMPDQAGAMTLWGRTYDLGWSSPSRWRVDDGPWQTLTAGPSVDRQIFSGSFVVEWRKWGEITFAPGPHRLRVELTGPRPQDPKNGFFVMDQFLLARGDYQPAGSSTPADQVSQKNAEVKALAQQLGSDGDDFIKRGDELADQALKDDLGALLDFQPLLNEIQNTLSARQLVEKNEVRRLHGAITALNLAGNKVHLETHWNVAFGGKMWIGFKQNNALYAAQLETVTNAVQQNFDLVLPDNLPSGYITVQCVPLDVPTAETAQEGFILPDEQADPKARALAWGLYRDANFCIHPWHVSLGGMMLWEETPYLPVGGMMNLRSTWQTVHGESDDTQAFQTGSQLVGPKLQQLAGYGIKDIYFNGFGANSNPNALADLVGAAEKAHMRYGLEVTSWPPNRSRGFITYLANDPLQREVQSGDASLDLELPLPTVFARPPYRCVWALFSKEGELLDSGKGTMMEKSPSSSQADNSTPMTDLTMKIAFSRPATDDGVLVFRPEVLMGPDDPCGYYDGMDEFCQHEREVFGSLALGSGFRLWLDPFNNEIHSDQNQLCTADAFKTGYAQWLLTKHGSLEALNQAWMAEGKGIPSFATAAEVVPISTQGKSSYWMDPGNGQVYRMDSRSTEANRDLAEYRGVVSQEFLNRAADVLKSIADVPVILKQNGWASDWFVNLHRAGGQDGVGYEAYGYGDGLIYHNCLTAYIPSLLSARTQWSIVTETSPAAFDGQKDYEGYLDRIQMLDDFDQFLKAGAKGVYTFGFSFDPPSNFLITEITRDPRQLEWLATYQKMLEKAAPKLENYRPEVYGWYPGSLRENQLLGQPPRGFEMDGMYSGAATQIRMAPDGRWIVPAFRPDASWFGLVVAGDLLTPWQAQRLSEEKFSEPVYALGSSPGWHPPAGTKTAALDSLTASGIGVIPAQPAAMTLDQFREKILGYRVFQTLDVNGQELPDGRVMVWTCVEKHDAHLVLPAGVHAVNLAGKSLDIPLNDSGSPALHLIRPDPIRNESNLPPFTGGYGYYYPDTGQPEVAILDHVDIDQLLKINPPAWQRWLPEGVKPEQVTAWEEAEDATETTFNQPRVEGYSRYSGGSAIGINSRFQLAADQAYYARYNIQTNTASTQFWLRRMDRPAMDLDIEIDGKSVGIMQASDSGNGLMHLTAWNAGIGVAAKVGWYCLNLPDSLPMGEHQVEIKALPTNQELDKDTQLQGALVNKELSNSINTKDVQGLQIDAFMLVQ